MSLDPIYLSTAVEAARAAAGIHKRYFRQTPLVEKKGRIDLVTAADLEVEQMFRELVAERFPTHTVLGEEATTVASNADAPYRWIIDPVDGTTNFAHGLAIFCVSIALEIRGRIELGVIYDPMSDELFTAELGEGARMNGALLTVSSTASLDDALLVTGFPYNVREERREAVALFNAFLGEAQAVRRLGSAALDLCYLACGRIDGYWETKIHPWDVAAGSLLVHEAGGMTSGLDGAPFAVFGGQILASNRALHADMLDIIARTRASMHP